MNKNFRTVASDLKKVIFKKALSCLLVIALLFTSVSIQNVFNMAVDVQAAKNPNPPGYSENDIVDRGIIPDTELLLALKNIIGTNFTLKQLKEYSNAIDLSAYTNITDLSGMGYAVKVPSFDFSALTKVKTIQEYEFDSCEFKSIKLPSKLEEIKESGFYGCANLESVTLPETIKRLYNQAFYGCKAMKSVNLPESLEKIGDYAFGNCESIKNIVMPDSINATSESSSGQAQNGVGANVFNGCISLESIDFGDSMTAIPAGFLQLTTNLLSVNIPERITSIRANAFALSGLLSIDLSKNTEITVISEGTFAGCSYLKNVKLPSEVKIIEANAFASCRSIVDMSFLAKLDKLETIGVGAFNGIGANTITVPGNVTLMDKQAFAGCASLTTVTINDYTMELTNDKIKVIGERAFEKCNELYTVNLPTKNEKNVKASIEIGAYAFFECFKLHDINFPLNVTKIDDYAFSYCGESYTDWEKYNTGEKGHRYFMDATKIKAAPSEGYEKVYGYTEGVEEFCQPGDMYINRSDLLDSNDEIESLDAVVFIENNGKANSSKIYKQIITGLEEVDLEKNVNMEVGKGVFKGCVNLKTVTLPSDMTKIPDEMFMLSGTYKRTGSNSTMDKSLKLCYFKEWFYGVKTVNMVPQVTEIGESAFEDCYKLSLDKDSEDSTLKYKNLPSSLVKVNDYGFKGCASIGDLSMPATVEYIGEGAFSWCSRTIDTTSLRNIQISGYGLTTMEMRYADKINYIGKLAFAYATFEIFRMNGDSPVTVIGNEAFFSCQYLEDIKLSDKVEYVGKATLAIAARLKVIDIPDVCTIDEKGFEGKLVMIPGIKPQYIYTSYYIGTPTISIRPQKEAIAIRENNTAIVPLYTVLNGTVCTITDIKIGDYTYRWNNNGELEGENNLSPISPNGKLSFINHVISKTENTREIVKQVIPPILLGKTVASEIPVNIQLYLTYVIDEEEGWSVITSPVVSYTANVIKNPCKEIKIDSSYYVDSTAKSSTEINPTFVPEYNDANITDVISWRVLSNSSLITLEVAADGKSAVAKSTGAGCGSCEVEITAGSQTRRIYVYVTTPAYGVKLDSSKYDMAVSSSLTITATMSYKSENQEAAINYPDYAKFSSSDESIVKVKKYYVEDGISKCDLEAVSPGTATITVKAEAGNKKATCSVTVAKSDISLILSDSGTELKDGDTIEVIGKNTNSYDYSFSDVISSNGVTVVVPPLDADKVKVVVDVNAKKIKFTGLGQGTVQVKLYPTIGMPENGITLNVKVRADISGISLSKKTIVVGDTVSVFASMYNSFGTSTKINAASAENYKKITDNEISFTSSDPSVAVVDNYGNVTAKKASVDSTPVTITCTAMRDGAVVKSASTTVTTKLPELSKINYSGVTKVQAGKTTIIKCSPVPINAEVTSPKVSTGYGSDKIVSYTWDENQMALVIKGVGAGKVEFKVSAKGGYKTISTKFTVEVVKAGSSSSSSQGSAVKPGKVSGLKVKAGKRKVTIRWKKPARAKGYQIQMSKKKKKGFKTIKKVKSASKLKFVKKKLKRKKIYYFRVRAYNKNSKGKTLYGKWSKVKKVKIK